MREPQLPEGLTGEDYEISATIRDLPGLHKVLAQIERRWQGRQPSRLLDLGCGIGGLTRFVARQFDIDECIGVDLDESRLKRAADRGLTTIRANLNTDSLPIEDASIDLVISFGAFEHLVFYDTAVSEAFRVLTDGGLFLLAMPNLGSYLNRAALLFGYQPREVEVSRIVSTGLLPAYQRAPSRGVPLGHVHAATLRCVRDLAEHFGFHTVTVAGSSPDFGNRTMNWIDRVLGKIPSLSRRFIILEEKPPAV